ncbi:MAG: hypothetical protein K2Y02_01510 [Burkholderiaceae bacterium]|nr:hypothetical protein [Burkholderiaceae bacterium]
MHMLVLAMNVLLIVLFGLGAALFVVLTPKLGVAMAICTFPSISALIAARGVTNRGVIFSSLALNVSGAIAFIPVGRVALLGVAGSIVLLPFAVAGFIVLSTNVYSLGRRLNAAG